VRNAHAVGLVRWVTLLHAAIAQLQRFPRWCETLALRSS